jgi:hypothetical protein
MITLRPERSRSGICRAAAAQLFSVLIVCMSYAQANLNYVDGDPIGVDSSTTDNTGGFTAVHQLGHNIGQPAILVSLNGEELLIEFRAIVFGLPSAQNQLLFNEFDYGLNVWKGSDYFAGSEPLFRVDLGEPKGVNLIPDGFGRVIPDVSFGSAGVGGANAPTYDFRFDLIKKPLDSPSQPGLDVFDWPLPAGEWVFGFQSWHDTQANGILRVSGAAAEQGPLPLFSRDNLIPRGVLGDQDPDNILLYWGMSLAAVPADSLLDGDFSGDGLVDAADYVVWRRNLGSTSESVLNYNGDGANGVDDGDYDLWRRNFGLTRTILPGDFNATGVVDAAEYVIWRRNLGALSNSSLNNAGDGLNGVDEADYLVWRQNFNNKGTTVQSFGAPIAEPASLLLLIIAGSGLVLSNRCSLF